MARLMERIRAEMEHDRLIIMALCIQKLKLLTFFPETLTLKEVLLDWNRHSSCFVSKWTGSRPAQMVWFPKRVMRGSGDTACSSLQWSFMVQLLTVSPGWGVEGKGGGGRGGGAGGFFEQETAVETARSPSVWSSSSLRSEKSKVLRQRCSAGLRKDPQDGSQSHDGRFSLICSDSFILLFKICFSSLE